MRNKNCEWMDRYWWRKSRRRGDNHGLVAGRGIPWRLGAGTIRQFPNRRPRGLRGVLQTMQDDILRRSFLKTCGVTGAMVALGESLGRLHRRARRPGSELG